MNAAGENSVVSSPPDDGQLIIDHLRRRGLLDHDEVTVRPLSGGVSSDVLAVTGPGVRLVVKRALPRLRVSDEWLADPRRALLEARALTTAAAIAPLHVPPVIDVDEQSCTIVIGHAEAGAREWRTDLLTGHIDIDVAAQLGALLARWHDTTSADATVQAAFGELNFFAELRVEPFYHRVANIYPSLAPHIEAVVERMLSTPSCLVHGDFTPKNVLLGPDTTWVIDWEVAHFGDPHFDVALLITHLVCKSLHHPVHAAQLGGAAQALLDSYLTAAPLVRRLFDEPYLVSQIGCLLLARLDGPSRAQYLNPAARRRGREVANAALGGQISSLEALWRTVQ